MGDPDTGKPPRGVYSQGELSFMMKYRSLKDWLFWPMAQPLHKLGVSPFVITGASAFIAVFGLVLSFIYKEPVIFLAAIWTHLILDGLDGTLARLGKVAGQGAWADVAADSIGIISAGIFAAYFTEVTTWIAALFALFYLTVFACSYVRNKHGQPYLITIRPRPPLYAALVIDHFLQTPFSELVMLVGSILLGAASLTGIKTCVEIWRQH